MYQNPDALGSLIDYLNPLDVCCLEETRRQGRFLPSGFSSLT